MPTTTPPIHHHAGDTRGLFYVGDDYRAPRAAMMYHETKRQGEATTVNIDHTEVEDPLRGQGVGQALFDALIAWARGAGVKVSATCPFAVTMFERRKGAQDIEVAYVDERPGR